VKEHLDFNSIVLYVLVRTQDDISNDENVFKPDMTHQLFGDRYVLNNTVFNNQVCLAACALSSFL